MMMMNPPSFPLGFRFDPSDEELLSYLIRRATGLSLLPSGADHQHIVETQLYGDMANPWHVFDGVSDVHWDIISELGDDDEDGKYKRVIYVVTKLTKISKGKTRIARRAGCGTWSGQTPPKKIYNESGQWVGSMRMLSFERAKGEVQYHDPHDQQYHWIMHEYSLDGIHNNNNNSKVDKEYVICRITRLFKANKYSTNNDIINGTSTQVHEEEEVVVHVPAAPCPKKKRKREIITQEVDQGRRRYSPRLQLEHHVVEVSSSAGEEEEEAHHELGESSVVYHDDASNQQLVEYVSMPAETMAHHHHDESLVISVDDDEDEDGADFDKWVSSLDDVLLVDLPEEEPEDQNYLHSSVINHNNTTTGFMSLADQQEDHTQAAASNLDLVESVSVLETAPQQADDDLFEASTTIAADWMSLLDDVQLPDEDEDQNSNHNNWTNTAFNLDHLDLFQELCY